jgi:tetrapyrrole methylase family protein/MazG family protein
MTITILGLGPGDPAHLTREAWDVLSQESEIYLRTARHPTVASLPAHLTVHSFDDLYETLDDFVEVYEKIAERVIALGRGGQGVLYAVPGHPLVGESSVRRILLRAREEGLGVRLVEGLSFVEPVLSLLEIDGLDELQLADATDLAAAHHPSLDPDRPALIGQLYGQRLASEVKLTLMNAYPDEHPVTLVRAAGTREGKAITIPLYQLDRGESIDHLTALYLPSLPHVAGLPAFQGTVARLRAPDGCPWDREQTHRTLRTNLLEEAYEALAALDAEDDDKLCEELGDLLMQIAMHVQIATEEGAFRFADIIGAIDAKLKRRHPHVFGDLEVRGTADVLRNWEAIKASERASSGDGDARRSRLEGVPVTLPALARAQALGDRVARAGFDWPDLEGVLAKVGEEIAELREVEDAEARARELGDLLFTLVNVARWLGVDAESALRGTCDRFTRRYAEMERSASARGIDLTDLSLDEQDALWDRVKEEGENGNP